ncbi:MAG: DUF3891 family protein, partial [Thermodesulfobacteriota bacterium]
MIRREEKEGWFLINQHDHAELSGEILKYWENTAFETPDPHDEVLFATRQHDNGWIEWDSSPKVYPLNRFPMNFMEMNFPDQETIWKRSFRRYSADHPYASALIALHFRKFNQKIIDKNHSNSEAKKLKNEMNQFIANILNVKMLNSDLGPLPIQTNIILRLVQIGDIISLALCHGWTSIDIEDVPLNYNGSVLKLSLKSGDGKNFKINPYPF